MLKKLAQFGLLISIALMAIPFWALSSACNGRPLGYDCESWFIFGVNIFAPIGFFALVFSVWSLRSKTWFPQYLSLLAVVLVIGLWGYWSSIA